MKFMSNQVPDPAAKAEFTALQSSEAEARNNLRLSKEESARLEGELAAVKAGAGGVCPS